MAGDGALLLRRIPRREFRATFDTCKVTRERAECLAQMLKQPKLSTQRFVEQLSFVETGGQQWVRTLQIKIPPSAKPAGTSWRIVSLGEFKRRRRADLVVRDASGTRLNLLTRNQHIDASAKAVISRHTAVLRKSRASKKKIEASAEPLRSLIYKYFSTLDFKATPEDTNDRSDLIAEIGEQYEAVLTRATVNKSVKDRKANRGQANEVVQEFIDSANTTQYLCWVPAAPGEIVNLQVTYTATDPKHKIAIGTLWGACKALAEGILPASYYSEAKGDNRRIRLGRSRGRRADWYRQYGLAPIDYEFSVPRGDRAPGSYYFTLEPPPKTLCTYLDWEVDNTFNRDREVDAALPAAHLHDGPDESDDQHSGKIRAYLRCRPHHHKQILGVTALNIIIVALLARGRLALGGSLQGLIVAAPSVLLAFLVQQQRHYYAYVLRRQRLILWTYLAISAAFVVLVTVGELTEQAGAGKLHTLAVVAAWVLAISSAGVFMWHWPLGGSYERAVQYFTDRKWEMVEPPSEAHLHRRFLNRLRGLWWYKWPFWRDKPLRRDGTPNTPWECCAAAIRFYCNGICLLAIVAMLASVVLLHQYAHFSDEKPQGKPGHHAVLAYAPRLSTLTSTSNPNW